MSIIGRLLVVVSALSISIVASAGERLGTFMGSDLAMMGGHQSSSLADVRFQLRKDRGKLYMRRVAQGGSTLKDWKQSFEVISDHVEPDGARTIEYRRPTDASRSGRFNVKELNASRRSVGNQDVLDQLKGTGALRIKDGRITWLNSGSGVYHSVAQAKDIPMSWNELFTGASKVSLGKTAPAPIQP